MVVLRGGGGGGGNLGLVQLPGEHANSAGGAAAHAAGPRQQQPLVLRLHQHVPANTTLP